MTLRQRFSRLRRVAWAVAVKMAEPSKSHTAKREARFWEQRQQSQQAVGGAEPEPEPELEPGRTGRPGRTSRSRIKRRSCRQRWACRIVCAI